jgi:squalene cyclase
MQIVGLHWAPGSRVQIELLAKKLLAAQRSDGGWAQNPNLESDAYATGETLWGLRETGLVPVDSPIYRRGVDFLLNTQWPDGTWYVHSRAPRIQPYFESGFPYHHDQWISAAATSWAVLGLAPALKQNNPDR